MHILLGTAAARPMEKELSHPTFLLGNLAILSSMNRLSRIEDLSYHDMQQRVFESCGGILLGWRDFSKYHPELNPNLKHQINEWDDSQAALVQNMCLISWGGGVKTWLRRAYRRVRQHDEVDVIFLSWIFTRP